MSDTASISDWASIRLAVGAALFITYFIFYLAYYFATFKQSERPKLYIQINDLASKMYLYGIGCLLSINYLQTGIFHVLFAYLTMITVVLVLVMTIIDSIGEKLRVGANILFYTFLSVWYIGIVIDYFGTESFY